MRYLFLLALLLVGCDNPLGLGDDFVPPGSVQYDAIPVYYAEWWSEVEEDSGFSGNMDRVRWFKVPGDSWYHPRHQKNISGMWKRDHRIFLAESTVMDRGAVKHEMLHDLTGGDGDPGHTNPLFFRYAGQ